MQTLGFKGLEPTLTNSSEKMIIIINNALPSIGLKDIGGGTSLQGHPKPGA